MGLFVAVTFGSAYPIGKALVSAVEPVSFSVYRYLIAGSVMLLAAEMTGRRASVSLRDLAALAGMGVLGYTIFQGTWAVALQYTTPAKAVILVATTPIFGAFFAMLAGQKVSPAIWLGAFVAFLGVYLVVNDGIVPGAALAGAQWIGDVLFVGIAAVWALFGLLSRPYVQRLGAWTTTGWAALLGAIILLPFAGAGMIDGRWGALEFDLAMGFLYVTFIVGCLGNAAWAGGLSRLGLPSMTLYLYLSPVIGAALSAAFLGDWLSPAQLLGAVLVIGGVALGQFGEPMLRRLRAPPRR